MLRISTLLLAITISRFIIGQQFDVDTACWTVQGDGRAVLEDPVNDRIFIGGTFSRINHPRPMHNGVEVDAVTGYPARYSSDPDGVVHCVLSDQAGGWYIGGDFAQVGGQARARLAHILPNGAVSAWAPVVTGSVRTMLIKGDTLYFGGGFTNVNGAVRSHLAAVRLSTGNNVAWSQGTANDTVRCLSLNSGRLYVGGDFTQVNGSARTRLASFTVSTHTLTTWAPNVNDKVRSVIATSTAVYIGGDLTTVNGMPRGGAASLNPTGNFVLTWSPNTNGAVNCMLLSGVSIFLGGSFTQVGGSARGHIAQVASGSTATLSAWDIEINGEVRAMAALNDLLYVAGGFTGVDDHFRSDLAALGLPGTTAPAVAQWSTSAADPRALAAHGSSVFVGGDFSRIGVSRKGIAALDRSTGEPLTWAPRVEGSVHALEQSADGTLYVGGSFSSVGGVARSNLVALDPVSAAVLPWSGSASLGSINDMELSGDTLVVCGSFAMLGSTPRLALGALSRTTGAVLPWSIPLGFSDVPSQLLLNNDTLYLCGSISMIGGQQRHAIAAVRLSSASVLPFVADCSAGSEAHHMALAGSKLYVGGVEGTWSGTLYALNPALLVLDKASGALMPWRSNHSGALAVSGTKVFSSHAGYGLVGYDAASGWGVGESMEASCREAIVVAENGDLLCAGPTIGGVALGGFFRVRLAPSITIRAMLDGPFNAGSMKNDLNEAALLPVVEPYTSLGYAHVGGGGGETGGFGLNAPGLAIIDWVLVEYRDANDPSIVVASASRLMWNDGEIRRSELGSLPTFTADPNGSYYVAVRHRNHLGVMTAQPVDFSTSPFIDFTSPTTAVYGTNARKSNSGVMCLWAGDVNFNGVVKYTGAANDRDPILVSIGGASPNSTLSGVYSASDVNMDGQVKYTGNKNDRDRILLSIGGTTPNSTRAHQLP